MACGSGGGGGAPASQPNLHQAPQPSLNTVGTNDSDIYYYKDPLMVHLFSSEFVAQALHHLTRGLGPNLPAPEATHVTILHVLVLIFQESGCASHADRR